MWQLTLMPYQSLRVKGSWALFLRPFLPLDSLLFLRSGISHRKSTSSQAAARSRAIRGKIGFGAQRTCQQPS